MKSNVIFIGPYTYYRSLRKNKWPPTISNHENIYMAEYNGTCMRSMVEWVSSSGRSAWGGDAGGAPPAAPAKAPADPICLPQQIQS